MSTLMYLLEPGPQTLKDFTEGSW